MWRGQCSDHSQTRRAKRPSAWVRGCGCAYARTASHPQQVLDRNAVDVGCFPEFFHGSVVLLGQHGVNELVPSRYTARTHRPVYT